MVLTQDTLFDFLASQGRKGVVMKLKKTVKTRNCNEMLEYY